MSDWSRIEAIFGHALELAPNERNAYLDQACADDPAVRAEVESLLACDADASPTFLAKPLDDPGELPVDVLSEIAEPPGAGERVGNYRLVEKLSEDLYWEEAK